MEHGHGARFGRPASSPFTGLGAGYPCGCLKAASYRRLLQAAHPKQRRRRRTPIRNRRFSPRRPTSLLRCRISGARWHKVGLVRHRGRVSAVAQRGAGDGSTKPIDVPRPPANGRPGIDSSVHQKQESPRPAGRMALQVSHRDDSATARGAGHAMPQRSPRQMERAKHEVVVHATARGGKTPVRVKPNALDGFAGESGHHPRPEWSLGEVGMALRQPPDEPAPMTGPLRVGRGPTCLWWRQKPSSVRDRQEPQTGSVHGSEAEPGAPMSPRRSPCRSRSGDTIPVTEGRCSHSLHFSRHESAPR